MTLTRRPFEPSEHACASFLGQQVPLPELHAQGFHPRLIASLENPLDSLGAAWNFVDCMKWGFLSGVDDKLSPEHWGVAWARGCEALYWRFQDLLEEKPLWGLRLSDALSYHKQDEPPPNTQVDCLEFQLHYEGGVRDLQRDLLPRANLAQCVVEEHENFSTSRPLQNAWVRLVPNPAPERLEHHSNEVYGQKWTYAFWAPMDVGLVLNAIRAWDAARFGGNKFSFKPVSAYSGDVAQAMGALFGESCASGIRAYQLSQALPDASAPSAGVRPRF